MESEKKEAVLKGREIYFLAFDNWQIGIVNEVKFDKESGKCIGAKVIGAGLSWDMGIDEMRDNNPTLFQKLGI